ncbi:EscR/YscR/HrcR family type III secretion system export apparatus protein [Morganella psychrotolerans]|uniref:EscR/YscR/HrcR family type III secretion system export apparatus protein n=1 Tax=Morganella psychrotolerans TaxID=368603 RepID=A0A5M9R563_9GAMM|nr:EscR/YscR/HrcR family type III secretion system export apparatus protein [Morganella psychrotolerans]KAA8715429.1 EscR/YscR/HrcR family type III secretion system export apparatus protein [Morganella psychrotolerans]OBU05475.1 EscR/YscR/HrcR family type III secretion system export apparatus protein [Morganella psychrotolerans]
MTDSAVSMMVMLAAASLLPFILAAGTCYLKFSIVFVMVRNALGVQQVPSNMVLNAIALILSMVVMFPIASKTYYYTVENPVELSQPESLTRFVDEGLHDYRQYLFRYADKSLLHFFAQPDSDDDQYTELDENSDISFFHLLAAYALAEIKAAFLISFYLYLPFIVIDLIVSSVLLALGMMMMSPVTLSVPIKLILFIALDGWSLLSTSLVSQYIELMDT